MPKRKRVAVDRSADVINAAAALDLEREVNAVQPPTNGPAINETSSRTSKRRRVDEQKAGISNRNFDSPRKQSAKQPSRKVEVKLEPKYDNGDSVEKAISRKKVTTKTGTGKADDALNDQEVQSGQAQPKAVRKRKTKEEKEAEAMPLVSRTVGHKLFIGAHVSSAGGVHNSVLNSVYIGGNAFALFLKSQRKWENPPLQDEHCMSFHGNCQMHAYDQAKHVVPHGSYLVNLAHTDPARTEQAYSSFLDDLKRCESLGIGLYNFHPGVANSVGDDRAAAVRHLAANINRAHKETSTVVTLLENMAAGGNVLGSTFEDLRDIISLIDDKQRVGVCLDTCHAFAGGYELRTPAAYQQTMSSFEGIVGLQYLRAVHMNDSKAPFASHRDLHANIGTGFLGLRSFHNIVNDRRFVGLPLVLETPTESKDERGVQLKDEKGKVKEDKGIWAREIKLLESLVGMDAESDAFTNLERELALKGEAEREKMMAQFLKKQAEKKVKELKGGSQTKRSKKETHKDDDEQSHDDSD